MILYGQGNEVIENTSIHGLIWANLAFVAALIFHAGISVNRIQTLERDVKEIKNSENIEKLTALKINVDNIKQQMDHIHKGLHDLRNLMMKVSLRLPE